ncbi:hypothetical protein HMF3257_04060 [Spirosoma telluris]|uniref:Uncharacterized protein n=2 Tax=Spirosoma telluris TaxID=2183553 RepID=A0A327NIL7_9BACT|nr:hypothetical protein HMF3257_04060 [Spirosoma telluris]
MLIKTLGPRLTEWENTAVFFRHHICERNNVDAFYELTKKNSIVFCLRIELASSILLEEYQWYKIIRYCLLCIDGIDSPSVVFSNPCKSNSLEIFIQNPKAYINNDVYKKNQKLLYQLMAMQISIWLYKPSYIEVNFGSKDLSQLSSLDQQRYIARAIFDSLSIGRVRTITQLINILKGEHTIETDIKFKNEGRILFRFRCSLFQVWHTSGEFIMSTSDIKSWLNFNNEFNDSLAVDRVLNGIK